MSTTAFNLRRARLVEIRICLFFLLASQIQAYTLSSSCFAYGKDKRDISQGIQAAMAEASAINEMARNEITQSKPELQNTKDHMFPNPRPNDPQYHIQKDYVIVQSTKSYVGFPRSTKLISSRAARFEIFSLFTVAWQILSFWGTDYTRIQQQRRLLEAPTSLIARKKLSLPPSFRGWTSSRWSRTPIKR
jgi:hypothetical protein